MGTPISQEHKETLLEGVRSHHERAHKSRDLSTLGGLTASLAHEVRNILAGVLGLAQLRSRPRKPIAASDAKAEIAIARKDIAVQTKAFQTIASEAERGTLLLSNLLNVTRSDGPPQLVSLSDILDPVEQLTLSEVGQRRAAVRFLYSSQAPPFVAGAARLKQVLLNLTLNALQATGEGGTIEVSGWLEGPCAVFTVSDDGPGVPEAAKDKIFEAFFSTKVDRGGTGLGLYQARMLVEEQGGKLSVGDAAQGGACFRVEVPVGSASTVQEAGRS